MLKVEKYVKETNNIVDDWRFPNSLIPAVGMDVLRLYVLFCPNETNHVWKMKIISGLTQFLHNFEKRIMEGNDNIIDVDEDILILHSAVTGYLNTKLYHLGIDALMGFIGKYASTEESLTEGAKESLIKLLAPFAPLTAMRIWRTTVAEGCFPILEESWENPPWDNLALNDAYQSSATEVQEKLLQMSTFIPVHIQRNGKKESVMFVDPAAIGSESLDHAALKAQCARKINITNWDTVEKTIVLKPEGQPVIINFVMKSRNKKIVHPKKGHRRKLMGPGPASGMWRGD